MAGGGSVSAGGAESRCRAGPPLVPRRRMEFELLENDVLESLEDLGYVCGGEGAGRSRCGPGAEGSPGMGHSAAVRPTQAGPLWLRRAQGNAWSGPSSSEPSPERGW